MQSVFISHQSPEDYLVSGNGAGKFPDAPSKCPFKDCGMPIELKKHGFYHRFLILCEFEGEIVVRRYICRMCKRTVSMLPSFCLAKYTYGVDFVVGIMREAVETGSKRTAAKAYSSVARTIDRRHVSLYLHRLQKNRKLIQYGFNQISPGSISIDDSTGDIEWTRIILLGKRPTLTPESNAEFHKETGKSFMSTQNKIA